MNHQLPYPDFSTPKFVELNLENESSRAKVHYQLFQNMGVGGAIQ